MKVVKLFALCIAATSLMACGKDAPKPADPIDPGKTDTPKDTVAPKDTVKPPVKPPVTPPVSTLKEPAVSEFVMTASMTPSAELIGADWKAVDSYMKKYLFEYSEHPNASSKDHADGLHIEVVNDTKLNMPVFKFMAHKNDQIIDGDRGSLSDRQRNEMKSRTAGDLKTNTAVNGNYGEWQMLEWKFMVPKGFQPSTAFTHIHQLKANGGDDTGSPVMTISLRSDSNGGNKRLQVIHTGRSGEKTGLGTIVDNVPMSELEDRWVQVRTRAYFARKGYYHITITRIDDGKVLVDKTVKDVDMWRTQGATDVRNKYGIYRNVGSNPFGSNKLLKDESLYLTDFKVYETKRNTNPEPVED